MSADDSKEKTQRNPKGSPEEHQINDELAVKAEDTPDEEAKTPPEEDKKMKRLRDNQRMLPW